MRYDHGYPVDMNQQCIATTRAGRRCKNNALVQGDVRLSDGTMAIVTEPKCALHGGQAGAANTTAQALNAAAEAMRRTRKEAK